MKWTTDKETAEDISQGQIVIITARWILLVAAWVLTLWEPEDAPAWQLRLAIVMLMAYSVGNFFLTVQWLKRSVILEQTVYATSFADLTLITVLVLALGSYSSNLYVFYFPALLALAVTFPRQITAAYTAGLLATYGAIALGKAGEVVDTNEAQTIVIRLILLAAVAFCGALYRGLEADRRAGRGRMFEVFRGIAPAGDRDGATAAVVGRSRQS